MPRVLRSAGVRLAALAAGLIVLCMVAMALVIYLSVRDDMEDQLRAQVSAETRQLLGDYADDGLDELRHDISERLERNPGTRLQYTLVNPAGVALFDRLTLPAGTGWTRIEQDDRPALLLLTTNLQDGYRLGIAADTGHIAETADAMRHAFLIVVIPMTGLAILVGILLSRRFLARVERVKETADRIGRETLSARLVPSGSGDDFDGLIETINRMLDRIEELVHDVRHVSTNIAHDLRSPLGRLRQRLEAMAGAGTADEVRQNAGEALILLDDTLETFSAMLRIADLETRSLPAGGEAVDLGTLIDWACETYDPVAAEQGSTLTARHDAPASVPGERALLTQMVSNLVENAIRHNPGGANVTVSCGQEGGRAFVRVSDDGIGISEAELVHVIKPFRRTDTSRTTPGNGLGLSLVSSIAAYHGAELILESPGKGLTATVYFG